MGIHRLMASETDLAKDLSGKTYLVTGANSGVGMATTRQLVSQGATVIMACRNVEKASQAAATLSSLPGSVEIVSCDLASLDSVRHCAGEVRSKHSVLDGLVGNAGGVMPRGKTATITRDGFEETFQSNYLGHFVLFEELLPLVRASNDGRIVILSSVAHASTLGTSAMPSLHLDDLNFEHRQYSSFDAYGEAKLAAVLYAKELAPRVGDDGVLVASVHPGWARSNFGHGAWGGVGDVLMNIVRPLTNRWSDSNEEASQTTLHVLLSDDARKHSGAYFSQHSVLYRNKQDKKGGWPMASPNPQAHDERLAAKLVDTSRAMVSHQ